MNKENRFRYTKTFLQDEIYILSKSKKYTRKIVKELEEAIKVLEICESGNFLDSQII